MTELSHLINMQRILLHSKGYAEPTRPIPDELEIFLNTLHRKLNEWQKENSKSDVPCVFVNRMDTAYENRYFIQLDFTYEYLASKRELALAALGVSDFDISFIYKMADKRCSNLVHAKKVFKDYCQKNRSIRQIEDRILDEIRYHPRNISRSHYR